MLRQIALALLLAVLGLPASQTLSTTARQQALTTVTGTAFAVDLAGLLLTAFHVVDGAREISVTCPGSSPAGASVLTIAPLVDLAVLRVNAVQFRDYLPLNRDVNQTLGQRVFTIGFPAPDMLGTEPKYTEGTIAALSGPGGDASYLQISVPVQPGNSGGPLLDESGRVVGVVVAGASAARFLRATGALPQNVNWAVKAAFAVPLLERAMPAGTAADREHAIAKAMTSTCLVRSSVPRNETVQTATSPEALSGLAQVQFVQPNTKRTGTSVVTKIAVRNVSSGPIAGLTVTETWYDKGGNRLTSGKGVVEGLLQPGQSATITIATRFDSRMSTNNWNFSHANGQVNPIKVQ